jgi:selenophosphate synthetase-related protein
MAEQVTLKINGTSYGILLSGITQKEAKKALENAEEKPVGRGVSHVVTTTRAGAQAIEKYARSEGERLSKDDAPAVRVDGRALLIAADRVAKVLAS